MANQKNFEIDKKKRQLKFFENKYFFSKIYQKIIRV